MVELQGDPVILALIELAAVGLIPTAPLIGLYQLISRS